jgi:hypothetical protein
MKKSNIFLERSPQRATKHTHRAFEPDSFLTLRESFFHFKLGRMGAAP